MDGGALGDDHDEDDDDRGEDEPEDLRPRVVNVDALAAAVTEAAGTSATWDGWSDQERHELEVFYGLGLRQLQAEPRDPDIMVAPDHRAASLLLSMASELSQDGALGTNDLDNGAAEARFDTRDVGWVRTGMGWLRNALKVGRFDWVAPPEQPVPLPDGDCRLAILGDWGSGMYGAPFCAESIAGDTTGFDLVIHVGDVYYSGTGREVKQNFLSLWPWSVKARTPAGVTFRACNSNHEMYSGGKPYLTRTVRRFGQGSSAFALENRRWLLVGLDTAYREWHLAEDQVGWLDRLLARDDGRRAVLFSHHQPYSHFEAIKGELHRQVDGVLARHPGKVAAWYWGHEHLGVVYDVYRPWGLHGRCVGHSGFPYFRNKALNSYDRVDAEDRDAAEWLARLPEGSAPAALVVDGPNVDVSDKADQRARYGPNGYLTVTLHDDGIDEELRSARGLVLHRRSI
jgi:hypothetical protein